MLLPGASGRAEAQTDGAGFYASLTPYPAARRSSRFRRRWAAAFVTGWAAAGRELAERERRVLQAELGDLAEIAARASPARPARSSLRIARSSTLRRPARAHEVRVVGVRHPVRLRTGRADDAGLLDRERRVVSARRDPSSSAIASPPLA